MAKNDTSFCGEAFRVAAQLNNGRTVLNTFSYCLTELGELSEEIVIAKGRSYKDPGSDGVTGEAVDVMLCLFDISYLIDPNADVPDGDRLISAYLKEDHNVDPEVCLAQVVRVLGEVAGTMDGCLHPGHPLRALRSLCWIISNDAPGTTLDDLMRIGRPKIDKWVKHAYEGVAEAPGCE